MKISTDTSKIQELLARGVEEIIDRDHLKKQLESGKQLRIKLGIDPTSPNLHLGRSVPLLKLRDFQELGHQIVFIVGDATGVIGDTSDKDAERPMLSGDIISTNLASYKKQVGMLLDLDKIEFRHNSEWLNKLGYGEIGEHANVFSLAEFIARENIKKRLEAGKRISLRELLYPLMQGYDSVAIKADVELGGTDQRFNLLAGRALQEKFGQEPQNIIMNPIVVGTDGRKMSSSWGNTINFSDIPNEMFGKIMSIPDDLIIIYFEYFTRFPMAEVNSFEKKIKEGVNPRDLKVTLASEIVRMYHGEKSAQEAIQYFESTFSKKEIPDDIKKLKPTASDIVTVLKEAGFCSGSGDARRNIDSGGVKVNGERAESYDTAVKSGDVIQKGKRYFVRIV